MKLRSILFILTLLVVLYATIGVYLYFSSMRDTALNEARSSAQETAEAVGSRLSAYLSQNMRPASVLAGLPEMRHALEDPNPNTLSGADGMLDHFSHYLSVDVCYLMNLNGVTVATSNRGAPDSFLGKNFAFRPYFKDALIGKSQPYMALGNTSLKRGAYYSHLVISDEGLPLGVVVIKTNVDTLERHILNAVSGTILLVDPNGIIFLSNRPDWEFKTLWKLAPEAERHIAETRQFGPGPWSWSGLKRESNSLVEDAEGETHLFTESDVINFPGWKVVYLSDPGAVSISVLDPLIKPAGIALLLFCLIGTAVVYLLYKKASREIALRHEAEAELRRSRRRYRTLYHHTPALLHSIDAEGKIVSASDYWIETLGYDWNEVRGRPLSDFMTDESRTYAEEITIPTFFEKGYSKDISYQFRKKNGEIIDVLLSAIAELDEQGNISRSLAVLVDITERKRAEEELRQAKELLAEHSRNLEQEVAERTAQIRTLSASIMTGQENERKALARELHDHLGQVLTALRMDSVWLRNRLRGVDYQGMSRAGAMCDLIDRTIDDVRSIATRLRPAVLDDLGLIDALEWQALDFEVRTGIVCIFAEEDVEDIVERIDNIKTTAAYRIAQEALTNIARHAKATSCEITLTREHGKLVLEVGDNGKGFDTEGLGLEHSIGLAGMRERAQLVGGTLTITSAPGKGTRVVFTMDATERDGASDNDMNEKDGEDA